MDEPCRAQPGPVAGFKVTFSSSLSGHRGKRRDFPSRLPPRAACPQMLRVAAPASAPDAKQLIFVWLLQAASQCSWGNSLPGFFLKRGQSRSWTKGQSSPGHFSHLSWGLQVEIKGIRMRDVQQACRCEEGQEQTPQTPLGLAGLGNHAFSPADISQQDFFWQDHRFRLGNFSDNAGTEIEKKAPSSCLLEYPPYLAGMVCTGRAELSSWGPPEHPCLPWQTRDRAGTTLGWLLGFPRPALTSPRKHRVKGGPSGAGQWCFPSHQ